MSVYANCCFQTAINSWNYSIILRHRNVTNSIPTCTSYQVDLIPLRTVVRRYLGITLINLAGAIEIIWQFFLKHTNNYDYDEINKIRPWSADSLRNFVSFSYFYLFISIYTAIRSYLRLVSDWFIISVYLVSLCIAIRSAQGKTSPRKVLTTHVHFIVVNYHVIALSTIYHVNYSLLIFINDSISGTQWFICFWYWTEKVWCVWDVPMSLNPDCATKLNTVRTER